MGEGALLIVFIVAQRLAELAWAEHNRRRLVAAGGVEASRAHYPLIVALHAAWLVTLFLRARGHEVDRAWLAVFIALQGMRIWVLATLGGRWTTRIVVLPGGALIERGPYRFVRHPNYLVVALEIAVVPLALGLPGIAVLFSLLNGVVLWLRIRAEKAALAWAAKGGAARPDVPAGAEQTLANSGRSL
jgi:methyltransferase